MKLRKSRQENERAWKVSLEDIKARNYNLAISNPNSPDEGHGDPADLIHKYFILVDEIRQNREKLKNELMVAPGGEGE